MSTSHDRGRRVAVASATAVLVAVGGLAVHTARGSERADPGSRTTVEVPASSERLQSEARRVFASFAGTKEQQGAAGVLQAWALNGAMDRCMEAAGHPEWDWSRARSSGVGPGDALTAGELFAAPDRLTVGESIVATRAGVERELALMAEDPTGGYAEAIDRCLDDPGPPVSARGREGKRVIARLVRRWFDLVRNLDRYGDVAAYRACLDAAELDVLSGSGEPITDVRTALARAYPSTPTDVPESVTSSTASAEWKAAVALERQFVDASWACRATTYDEHVGDVLRDIDDFRTRWADEIAAARAAWARSVTEAQALGYDAASDTVVAP